MIVIREAEIRTYGTYLKVESQNLITMSDNFKINLNDKTYYFMVERVKILDCDSFVIESLLTQIGFSNHINKEPNFDVRDLINSDLVKITDEEELKNIYKKGEN